VGQNLRAMPVSKVSDVLDVEDSGGGEAHVIVVDKIELVHIRTGARMHTSSKVWQAREFGRISLGGTYVCDWVLDARMEVQQATDVHAHVYDSDVA
jgi:hypothetical protein